MAGGDEHEAAMAVDEDLTQRSDGALAITAEEAGGVSQSQNPAVLAGDFH